MRLHRIRLLLARGTTLVAALAAFGGAALAAPAGCAYPERAQANGTGMGGTGVVGHGSGIGGTGIRPGLVAGHVIFSQGAVEARNEGRIRALGKGAVICVGETVVTARSGTVQIRMADGGLISVRPETQVRIDTFRFNGREDGTERSVIALIQGGFRALTGMIGHTHKENYTILTPTATIDIRGTDHEPMYIPTPTAGQAAGGKPGTYDKVNSGGVVIRTPQGTVEVKPSQVGFVPNEPGASPVLLREMPRFYQSEAGRKGGAGHAELRGEGHEPGESGQPDLGRGNEFRSREGPEIRLPEVTAPELQVPEMRGPEN